MGCSHGGTLLCVTVYLCGKLLCDHICEHIIHGVIKYLALPVALVIILKCQRTCGVSDESCYVLDRKLIMVDQFLTGFSPLD